jgi:hypothetical protein
VTRARYAHPLLIYNTAQSDLCASVSHRVRQFLSDLHVCPWANREKILPGIVGKGGGAAVKHPRVNPGHTWSPVYHTTPGGVKGTGQ